MEGGGHAPIGSFELADQDAMRSAPVLCKETQGGVGAPHVVFAPAIVQLDPRDTERIPLFRQRDPVVRIGPRFASKGHTEVSWLPGSWAREDRAEAINFRQLESGPVLLVVVRLNFRDFKTNIRQSSFALRLCRNPDCRLETLNAKRFRFGDEPADRRGCRFGGAETSHKTLAMIHEVPPYDVGPLGAQRTATHRTQRQTSVFDCSSRQDELTSAEAPPPARRCHHHRADTSRDDRIATNFDDGT